ncbi:ECF family RNA polymerase sigma factor [Sorangium cellulosum]|uniref:ECF family RNA polymerase sigma factor n=2 Tax=Sorangium cellulosum TaxID=56 RepID=A0A2L0EQ66_SORCE|nr:ECF family RNA polymerase sigma factor [Sorangium cellulosum]
MPLDRQRAFVRLFRGKTYDSVWNWLRRLGVPRRDRRDILQDVFLAGYESFPTYDPLRARPERWLNRITVHVAAHYRDRAHHRREELSAGRAPRVADERPSAEDQIDAEQTRTLLLSRLTSLDAEERKILIEHDLDGVPMATVAEQHGIPLSTAYKWRARAIGALRALVEEPRAERTRKAPRRAAGRDPWEQGPRPAAPPARPAAPERIAAPCRPPGGAPRRRRRGAGPAHPPAASP